MGYWDDTSSPVLAKSFTLDELKKRSYPLQNQTGIKRPARIDGSQALIACYLTSTMNQWKRTLSARCNFHNYSKMLCSYIYSSTKKY